jgi:hypothetical protein
VLHRSGRDGSQRVSGGVVWGLILIVLGAAFLLENLGLIFADDVLNLWPCALIAFGLLRLWNRGFFTVWGHMMVLGGVLCQAGVWFEAVLDLWWPILVVWAGLLLGIKAFLPVREGARERRGRRRYDDGMGDVDADSVAISTEGEERAR